MCGKFLSASRKYDNSIILYITKGELMAESNSRVRITVLLDDETLKAIRDYGYATSGTTNVSKAIMSMVKEHGKNTKDSRDT